MDRLCLRAVIPDGVGSCSRGACMAPTFAYREASFASNRMCGGLAGVE
jgi:hypothetical protein